MALSHRALGALSMVGAAALAIAAAPVLAQDAAAPAGTSHLGIPVDRIGVVSFTIREQLGEDPRGTLEAIAACGIQNIEFSSPRLADTPPTFAGVPVSDIAAMGEEFGFNVPSLGVGGGDLTDRLDVVVAAAQELGAEYVRISGVSDVEGEAPADYYARLAGVLNEAGAALAEEGITLLYHNHDQEFLDDVGNGMSGYDYLLAEVDPANAGFELDTYWSVIVDADPATLMQENPGRFPLLHVKDAMEETDPATEEEVTFATVGQGFIDFQQIFDQSEVAGVQYYFIENDRPMPDGVTSACEGYAYLASATAPN